MAVDEHGGEAGLGAAADVADVVATFPFLDVIERSWSWIASLAGGPWVLWLDDDVVPSPALLSALPALVAADDVTHYNLRHAWVWPDAAHVLDEPPWRPDFHPRLFRRDATAWFPGITHVPVKAVGPSRYVDRALLHLDLLLNPVEDRRAKVAAYEARRPGLRVAGRPLNEAYYLPEDRLDPPRVAPLPDEDVAAVGAALRLSGGPLDDDRPPRDVRRGPAPRSTPRSTACPRAREATTGSSSWSIRRRRCAPGWKCRSRCASRTGASTRGRRAVSRSPRWHSRTAGTGRTARWSSTAGCGRRCRSASRPAPRSSWSQA